MAAMQMIAKVENAAVVGFEKFDDTAIEIFLASRAKLFDNSRRTYRNALSRLFKFFSDKAITMPTEEAINLFLQTLTAEKKAGSTIRLYSTVAKSFFKWTARKKLYPDVAAGVELRFNKQKTHKKKALSCEQAKSLIAAWKDSDIVSLRNRAIISLCLQCGLRTVEISRLDVGDLDDGSNGYFVLGVQGKGHTTKDAEVKISPVVAEMIQNYLDARGTVADDEPMFISHSRNNTRGARLSAQTVGKMIKATMKQIGIKNRKITAHSTRHFAATQAIKAGVDLREVSSMLRHSNIEVTMCYLHDIELENRRAELVVADSLFKVA